MRAVTTTRRGFSIIEATLAVLLIGTTLVAALNVSAAAHRTSANANQRRQALRLAHVLMAEIMAQPASGTDSTNATGGVRLNNYDHVVDYEGLRQRPPTDIQGNALATGSWAWGSNVTLRGTESINARTLDLRLYQVTVFVEMPDGSQIFLRGFRSSSARLDRVPVVTGEATTTVPVRVSLPDGTSLRVAPMVRSQRPAEGSKPTMGVR